MTDILQILKKDENARKIFGEREIKIIEKQILGVNLTQSEKNRLSRDIRKKLEFIKEISRFENQFSLKKGWLIKERIQEAKQIILEHPLKNKIKKILLFGSVVENKATFRSDIDIAIVFSKIDKKIAFKFRTWVVGRVSDKVDIQIFNLLPKKIRKSILRKHRVLYER